MPSILVIGATGLTGRHVVIESQRRGLATRGLSRTPAQSTSGSAHDGVEYFRGNASTGAGLHEAMTGIDVVIDVMDGKFGKARKTLPDAAAHICRAASNAGVRRVVVLSIVNVDRVRYSYYQAKAAQERAYREAAVQSVIVRATQFHDLVTGMFDAGRKVGMTPHFTGARFQTIATADVAQVLVDAALAPEAADVTVGGPEALGMDTMARIYRQFTGARGPLVPLPAPGPLGRYCRNGLNLVPQNAVQGTTYAQWLEERENPSPA